MPKRGERVVFLAEEERRRFAGGSAQLLQREVPAGSLPALLAASAVLALQRLVLPMFHWMDDTRAFGILRPRAGSGR